MSEPNHPLPEQSAIDASITPRPHGQWPEQGNSTTSKLGDLCQKCRKRPSTTQWVGDGGALAYTHGFYELWCDVCVLTEQLKHARATARRIPVLERKLAAAKKGKRS